ncbi:MAG: aminopeptidase P family protein [Oscillospiraceae bacterium]|nr:aminopeptidase P family protein [Oscillospiraceae bacterium]
MIIKRIEKIQKYLKEKNENSAFIITSEYNRRYMTNISTSSGYIIITPENKYFFTDSRYIEFAKKSLGDIYTVNLYPKKHETENYYKELLKKDKIKNILFEENYIFFKTKKHFDELFKSFNLVESDKLIEKMREIKDSTEIENITKAQNITDNAFTHILKIINADLYNLTEKDIALELEYYMKKNGADNIAFDIIAVSGKKSSYPHGQPENIKLSKGFLTIDFGALYNGYCSDMTRTICIGKPDKKMIDIYNLVKFAQIAALEKIKADIEGIEVDKISRDIIRNAGYGENYGHGLGHSVGLEIHETPNFPITEIESEKEKNGKIKEKEKIILAENMVITVEPGIYIENEFGVRIEDLVVIKQNGYINLTKSNKDLIII